MSIMVFVERLYMGIVIILVKLFWKKPEKRYKWEPMNDDLEMGSETFPKVLVQIPMFNEKEVYKISIGAACNLAWPSDRLVIQVLDDSTDLLVKDMVERECIRWASKGINIRYQIRQSRGGYKAGALKEGLTHDYVKDCEYVVIFDADFRPEPDFLRRAVPFLIHNPDIALVQARWRFVNADECLLTRMQEMSLDYHFTVEQEVGSATHAFFGFNGTGGLWRIAAINDAGGWKDRTTVEDMDLAVRAGLKGWKFLYLGDLQVKSELPSTFKAFRFQQHRWSCGPANLFRKMVMEIAMNKLLHRPKARSPHVYFLLLLCGPAFGNSCPGKKFPNGDPSTFLASLQHLTLLELQGPRQHSSACWRLRESTNGLSLKNLEMLSRTSLITSGTKMTFERVYEML
ncbi:Glucomannan 4-beta-mannosyltransferase 2 [Sesamum angolense]|uniref:glucomannan 4-beta-mannosyltransferase n=1 Tax=Sesamum angolense TaxID=2727404 RepID=A0AAE2C576_9LAMI|nr:Glucomannan 4-beta-mannosyltransferase 2 [Sesamum angolense]